MAIAEKQKKVPTVRALRSFLEGVPDDMPIRSTFDEKIEAIVWKSDKDEVGPRKWLALDSI